MKNSNQNSKNRLIELEQALFSRKLHPLELAELIDDSFHEFGENGQHITKKDVINWLSKTRHSEINAQQFKVHVISDDVYLVTYVCVISKGSSSEKKDFRSSIWKRTQGSWRMMYHQATPVDCISSTSSCK